MTAWISSLRRSLASNARQTAAVVVLSSSALVTAVAVTSSAAVVVSSPDERTTASTTLCESPQKSSSRKDGTKLIFLGSGSSTGCPVGECLFTLPPVLSSTIWTHDKKRSSSQPTTTTTMDPATGGWIPQQECRVSHMASQGGDPKHNKDYRNNPSFLIHHYHNGGYKNIIIDVGKTFREGAMRWFPEFQIQSLDAIILTHEHMDAAAGLDDVRSFQPRMTTTTTTLSTTTTTSGTSSADPPRPPPSRKPVPLYLSQHCHDVLSRQFPFLLPPKTKTTADDTPSHHHSCCGGSDPVAGTMTPAQSPPILVQRDVAGFDVHIFHAFQPMTIEGLEIIPLPVWHGDDLISYGFAFSVTQRNQQEEGPETSSVNVVYISDVSRMIDETMEFIQERLPPTDILVVDALLWHRTHATHFSLDQAIELNEQIRPRMGMYVVGMSCEAYPPHEEMEAHLMTLYGGKVRMAHDGLCLLLDD